MAFETSPTTELVTGGGGGGGGGGGDAGGFTGGADPEGAGGTTSPPPLPQAVTMPSASALPKHFRLSLTVTSPIYEIGSLVAHRIKRFRNTLTRILELGFTMFTEALV